MKKLWGTYADRIDALSLRERVMVFAAALAATVFVMNILFIDPAVARKKELAARMAQQQMELQTLQLKIQALEKKRADPDVANRVRRDDIKRQITEIDDTLKNMQQSLVPAQRMNALLQEVLTRNPRLQLVAMRTLPVTLLVEKRDKAEKPDAAAPAPKSSEKPAASDSNVFKHGVQITVQGSYADLYDYLARLEKLSWRMFWSRASLSAGDYPRVTLTLTIYTLSLDKAWLEV
jgi:MSHA biogenesis protein MshJ